MIIPIIFHHKLSSHLPPTPGPLTMSLTMSELAPVLWPQSAPLPATRTPLPLPGAAAMPATDVPRRPSAPLATQGAELLLEPAMNPDPPGPPRKPGPKVRTWKRPRSTRLDTRFGKKNWWILVGFGQFGCVFRKS